MAKQKIMHATMHDAKPSRLAPGFKNKESTDSPLSRIDLIDRLMTAADAISEFFGQARARTKKAKQR